MGEKEPEYEEYQGLMLLKQESFRGTSLELERMRNWEAAYVNGQAIVTDDTWENAKKLYGYQETPMVRRVNSRKSDLVKHLNSAHSQIKISKREDIPQIDGEIRIEPKIDGIGITAQYRRTEPAPKGKWSYDLELLATRGDGRYGTLVNANAILGVETNLPNRITLEDDFDEVVQLRGEAAVIIPTGQGSPHTGTLWRSVTNGMLRRKVPANTLGLFQMFDSGQLSKSELTKYVLSLYNGRAESQMLEVIWPNPKDRPKPGRRFYQNTNVQMSSNGKSVIMDYNDGLKGARIKLPAVREYELGFYFYAISRSDPSANVVCLPDEVQTTSDITTPNGDSWSHIMKSMWFEDPLKRIDYVTQWFFGVDENWDPIPTTDTPMKLMFNVALDGIVIKPAWGYSTSDLRNAPGFGEKNSFVSYPSNQFAVKISSETLVGRIKEIKYKTTELGNKTVQGILESPLEFASGSTVTNLNFFNPEWVAERPWLHEGAKIQVTMSSDIIPIVSPVQ